jgi:dihydrofolate reductase
MRRIVAGLFMSLDGVVESPDKWSFPYFNDEVGQVIQSQMDASDAMLLGRRTYEEWAAYWPDKTVQDDPFAEYINNAPKFVVSTTLKSVEWRNSKLVTGNVAEELAKLKQQPGKDIAISGSITLVGSLLRDRLLDELSLLLNPVVVGAGKRLFEDPSGQVPLTLEESRALKNGVLSVRYTQAGT